MPLPNVQSVLYRYLIAENPARPRSLHPQFSADYDQAADRDGKHHRATRTRPAFQNAAPNVCFSVAAQIQLILLGADQETLNVDGNGSDSAARSGCHAVQSDV